MNFHDTVIRLHVHVFAEEVTAGAGPRHGGRLTGHINDTMFDTAIHDRHGPQLGGPPQWSPRHVGVTHPAGTSAPTHGDHHVQVAMDHSLVPTVDEYGDIGCHGGPRDVVSGPRLAGTRRGLGWTADDAGMTGNTGWANP